jgi:hypothetical protein
MDVRVCAPPGIVEKTFPSSPPGAGESAFRLMFVSPSAAIPTEAGAGGAGGVSREEEAGVSTAAAATEVRA